MINIAAKYKTAGNDVKQMVDGFKEKTSEVIESVTSVTATIGDISNVTVEIVEAATDIVSSMGSIEDQNKIIVDKVEENKEVSQALASLTKQFKVN